jgi:hypothetical protein
VTLTAQKRATHSPGDPPEKSQKPRQIAVKWLTLPARAESRASRQVLDSKPPKRI